MKRRLILISPCLVIIFLLLASCGQNKQKVTTELTSGAEESSSSAETETESITLTEELTFLTQTDIEETTTCKTEAETETEAIKLNEILKLIEDSEKKLLELGDSFSDLSRVISELRDNFELIQTELQGVNQSIIDLYKRINDLQEEINRRNNHVSVGGHDLVFSFPLNGNYYMSDHTFVGDELWLFMVSNDNHTSYSKVLRYSVDFIGKRATYLGEFKHNFGHCNTVDYCPDTNTLIMGNGGGANNPENTQIYIFPNADKMKEKSTVSLATSAIIIDIDELGLDFGKQLNVCFGESNNGKHNIVYAISNNGSTKTIRKLLLGQGKNKLQYGNFIDTAEGLEYNGTFTVLKKWETPYSSHICNQGTDWYKGKLYEGVGHYGIWHFEHELLQNGIVTKQTQELFYNDDGSVRVVVTEGITIKDGYMIMGNTTDNLVYVYWIG